MSTFLLDGYDQTSRVGSIVRMQPLSGYNSVGLITSIVTNIDNTRTATVVPDFVYTIAVGDHYAILSIPSLLPDPAGVSTLLTHLPGVVQPQTGDAFARLGTPVGASVSADIAAIPTALLDAPNTIETGLTIRMAWRMILAVLSGQATDSGTVSTFKRRDGATVALTITHDATGNRTASTLGSL